MADTDPTAPGLDALEETVGRLSKKPGVKATIILDRATGAILKTRGQIPPLRSSKSDPSSGIPTSQTNLGFAGDSILPQTGESQGAEEFASLVWAFVNASGNLVEELDAEDEVKLLRLRTKKQELVIVPDAKYLMVVVHDTPPA